MKTQEASVMESVRFSHDERMDKILRPQLYRIESSLPIAGKSEVHTLKEWKRIYGYIPGEMMSGRLVLAEGKE